VPGELAGGSWPEPSAACSVVSADARGDWPCTADIALFRLLKCLFTTGD
jgi:hypothetical protein